MIVGVDPAADEGRQGDAQRTQAGGDGALIHLQRRESCLRFGG
jgi:hypothetical protein